MLGMMAFSKSMGPAQTQPAPAAAVAVVPMSTAPCPTQVLRPEFLQNLHIEIADFSPEWDFITGGAKVLLCISPSLEQYRSLIVPEALTCRFDSAEVPATFVQGGVLKCYAPPHKAAFVQLSIVYSGEPVASTKSAGRQFEYRPTRQEKKKKGKNGLSFLRPRPDSRTEEDVREYKIRAIECLCCMESKLHSGGTTRLGDDAESASVQKVEISGREYSIEELRRMADEQLEVLSKIAFEKLVQGLFKELRKKLGVAESTAIIDQLDEHGCALLHYVVALDYYELIEIFYYYGAALEVKTKEGLTPLVISAAFGNKKSLSRLLSFGATGPKEEQKTTARERTHTRRLKAPSIRPRASMDPLRVAADSKHPEILEMLLRNMTLQDAMESNKIDDELIEPAELRRKIERRTITQASKLGAGLERESARTLILPTRPERRGTSERPATSRDYGVNSEELNTFVMKIQKNVREWLLRRHYRDIKQASKALHSTLERKVLRKTIDKSTAAKIIQKTVRAWLNVALA